MPVFNMNSFKLTPQELDSYGVVFKDENNQDVDMTYYVTKTPVKLEPTEAFPSFYMVNRYGDIYNDTQYLLVAYLRVMIPNPSQLYSFTNDGVTTTDYSKNPFHPYWLGGVDVGNKEINTGNPNRHNTPYNMSQLMDVIRYGGVGSSSSAQERMTYGIRNANTKVMRLAGIGEDLVTDQGGLPYGMFIPSTAKWLVFDTDATGSTQGKFYARNVNTSEQNQTPYADWRLFYETPDSSTSQTSPYMLPNLFVDHFSWFSAFPKVDTIGEPFRKDRNMRNAIAILTYGVQPV